MNTTAVEFRVKEIAFTGYPVDDIAKARAFYETVLGLKVSLNYGEEQRAWIEYDLGGSTLAITNLYPNWKPSASGPSVALEVDNFDAAVAALRASGAPFYVEPTTTPGCQLAVVIDPAGNSLTIHRRLH